ncbi:MAG: hypothetical protein KF906_05530 [Actinobacteria bacterium]|nr:hypothetical protein [Actinomycetota bacterium]
MQDDSVMQRTSANGDHVEPDVLPFNGAFRVRHRFAGQPAGDFELLGRHLALVWARDRGLPRDLPAPRDVLATAAAVTSPRLFEVVGLVGSHLASVRDLREQSVARLLAEIGRFVIGLEANGVEYLDQVNTLDCEDFIGQAVPTPSGGWAEPSISTRYLRRSSIRLLFGTARALQLVSGDPTLDIALPPRPARTTRPLDDAEEALGRIWSRPTLAGTRHSAAWALGQATATGSEQAAARVEDLDLSGCRVWLHGNVKKREPRWGQLTEWGAMELERRIAEIGGEPATPLLTAAAASRNARQASVCTAVSDVLRHAGLKTDQTVGPASLPAWAGRTVFLATGRIEDAAHALGVRSLDGAAAIIGWDW